MKQYWCKITENCIKAFIDGKGIANLKNCIDTYGEVVTEISYDILDQSIKYCKNFFTLFKLL